MHKRLKQNRGQLPISAPSTAPDHRQSPRTGTACRAPATQNKPNYRTAGVPPAFPPPNMRNEPNLHRGGPVEDQKCETNPIYPTPTIRQPKNTKRTQSTVPLASRRPSHPALRETNPIPARRIYETNPILTNQSVLTPCCIGTWINSGEVLCRRLRWFFALSFVEP